MALPLNQLPVIKRGWIRAALFFVVYILVFVSTGVLIGAAYGMSMVIKGSNSQPNTATMNNVVLLSLFAGSIMVILIAVLFRRFIDRQSWFSMGFAWKNFQQDAGVGFLLGPAILGAGSLILFVNHNLQWTDAAFSSTDFFMAVVLMLLIAISEEIVFRGYLLNNLMESMNKWVALLISALLFTIAHGTNPNINTLSVINLFIGGILLGVNYIYTKNLWFSICFHFSWNFLQGPILGYDVSGIALQSVLQQEVSGNPIITGGLFGFEGSILCSILTAITVGLLYLVYEARLGKPVAKTVAAS